MSITNLTNTRWKLNETLTGDNIPSCITWTNTYYSINADIDDYPISGFAYVKTPNLTPMSTLNPNLSEINLPSGALLCSLTSQQAYFPGISTFLTDCATCGLTDFNLGSFANAFYISMHVTSNTSGSAQLSRCWSSNITNRVLTIYGGADVRNTDLIAWLETNAEFEEIITPLHPNLNFKPLLIGEPYSSGKSKISFSEGYNKVKLSFQSNVSLNYVEARVTPASVEADIAVGQLGDQLIGSIAANTFNDLIIPVNSTTFINGSGAYVLSVYARSASDGTWTEVYFFLTVGEENFVTADGYTLKVLRTDNTVLAYDPPLVSSGSAFINGAWTILNSGTEVSIT